MYGLATPTDPLGGAIDRKNAEVKARLRERLAVMEPGRFEDLMGELLAALGFEDIEVTRYSSDGGIDVRGVLAMGGVTDIQTAIQVKRWTSNNVSPRVVRELRGALGPHEQGLIITLSSFTPDARAEAEAENRAPIGLVNGDRLLDLLMENEIGVNQRRVTIYELDEAEVTSDSDVADTGSAFERPPRRQSPRLGKALSVWPLPGGRTAWKASLDEMVRHVALDAPTMEDAIDWLIEQFERASSRQTARGYWQVPRSFGLLDTQGEQLTLTTDGVGYMDDPQPEALLDILLKNVAGFTEILGYLADAPHDMDQLLLRLRDDLGVLWETDAQVNFRLGWLENLDMVTSDGTAWHLTSRTASG